MNGPGAGGSRFPLQALVRLVLDDEGVQDWGLAEGDFWCRVGPVTEESKRIQGWKLHLSATPLSAPEVLHRAARVLVRKGCSFKFAARAEYVEELTSMRSDRAQCGKFITAYPHDDDQFRELAEELDFATAGLPGPAIQSDRPFRKGSIVHYRYGAFLGVPHVTNEGVRQVRLEAPDGNAVEDRRNPWFSPPPWAELPFPGAPGRPGVAPKTPKKVLLHDRYAVHEAIRHSARGGVYRALDQQTGQEVIVKQARAHVGGGYSGLDARDGLRAEAKALTELSGLGAELVELFDQDDHTFLVETVVPGVTLLGWLQERYSELEDQSLGLSCDLVRDTARRLAALLGDIHGRGLVYRDFTPNNVMVTPDGQLRLIDPEFLGKPGVWDHRAYTPGFAAPEYVSGPTYGPVPGQSMDLFALGAMLFQMATGMNPALPPDQPADQRTALERLDGLLALFTHRGAAAALLAPAIRGLCAQDPEQRWSLERLTAYLDETESQPEPVRPAATGPAAEPPASGLDPALTDRLIDDGLAHVLSTMAKGDAERLWDSTSFGATTDPCNVQHGAAGVLTVLTQADKVLAREDLCTAMADTAAWLDIRGDRQATTPLPGLYFGRAGTAWAVYDAARHLGDTALAERAARFALTLPVRWPNPDLFHGAAGAGLTQLHFWRATGRQEFLDRAADCADGVLAAAQHTDDGVFWPVPSDFDSSLAGITHLGYAHGVAGVGAFLLEAALATGREDCLDAARKAGETLASTAEHGPWGARWRVDRADEDGTGMLYHLCSGASGVGTFLIRLWRATDDPVMRELAEDAAKAVRHAHLSSGTSICHGLAGNGDFLLDMAQLLGGPYQRWAEDIAAALHARHALHEGRMLVPNETGMQVTADYGVGLAGVVAFLLRLRHGGTRPLMVDTAWPLPEQGTSIIGTAGALT
ncbi:class IV lanthionine synthetase LanL [Streptomyces sp. HUAS ZL42]|uniref:class IV lanthionine synthetase LanL n=1 Tax=Streptomyces sp. HUAS ZL42 TaxID=3231715 RepID=UPI00345EF089